jgi:RNA-directed DNA polymerase
MSSLAHIRRDRDRFDRIHTLYDLSVLIDSSVSELTLHSLKPEYDSFFIPKKNKTPRHIEDPCDPLKDIQRSLNKYLQAGYYYHRPRSVYGFCISHSGEPERNIVSHARQHIGHPYLLNVDLLDFFHQISTQQVHGIYETYYPHMQPQLTATLAALCAYRHRLPMGAPTSPVLSNYACITMDAEMEQWARVAGITYTRFADDMSFSALQPIAHTDVSMIRQIITQYHLVINEDKVKHYQPDDPRLVTGIKVLPDSITLPDGYLDQVTQEIIRFKYTLEVEHRYRTGMSLKKLSHFERELRGKLNFADMVCPDDDRIPQLNQEIDTILAQRDAPETIDWLDIPYDTY